MAFGKLHEILPSGRCFKGQNIFESGVAGGGGGRWAAFLRDASGREFLFPIFVCWP